jgi:ATP-dependent helicase YprA (DUF1998 family)
MDVFELRGKSLAFIIPIVDHVLRPGSGRCIGAIVVYLMSALVNSQQWRVDDPFAGGGVGH